MRVPETCCAREQLRAARPGRQSGNRGEAPNRTPVPNFDGWKKAFDSDPVGREKSGVRRYRVLRPIDDAHYVMIDLEFDTVGQAEALLAAMRTVWGRVEGKIMMDPQARIVEAVDTRDFAVCRRE